MEDQSSNYHIVPIVVTLISTLGIIITSIVSNRKTRIAMDIRMGYIGDGLAKVAAKQERQDEKIAEHGEKLAAIINKVGGIH